MNNEDKIIDALGKKAKLLRKELDANGGRGVELAEHIDRIETAIAALNGELVCLHCEAQITGK